MLIEEHKRWIHTNVTTGYNANAYSGEVFPLEALGQVNVRLPEGGNVLCTCNKELIDYYQSLWSLGCIEISTTDEDCIVPFLDNFNNHEEMSAISKYCQPLRLLYDDKSEITHIVNFF